MSSEACLPRWAPLALMLALLVVPGAAGSLVEVPLPTEARGPIAVATDADGRVWVTLHETWAVGRYDPRTNETVVVPLTTERQSTDIYALVSLDIDPQGVVWVLSPRHLHRVDPQTLEARAFRLPVESRLPGELIADSRGRIWISLVAEDLVLRFDGASSRFTTIEVPGDEMGPLAFSEGDVRWWVTLTYAGTIGTLDPARGEIEPSDRKMFLAPFGIVEWRDGVWVGEHAGNAVARYDPVTGTIDWFPGTQTPYSPIIGPSDLLLGSDGALWFSEHLADRVARLDLDNGTLVEWDLVSGPYTNTAHLAQTPDGTVWAGVEANDTLARVRYEGQQPSFEVPARVVAPRDGEVRVPINGSGDFVVGTSHLEIEARVEGREVRVTVGDPPPGRHRIVVSERDGPVRVGHFVELDIAESRRPAPVDAPAVPMIVLGALAAVVLAQQARRHGRAGR